MFAVAMVGLSDGETASIEPGINVAYVFRDEAGALVSPLLERPDWLAETGSETTTSASIFRGQNPGGVYGAPPTSAPLGSGYPGPSPFYGGVDPAAPFINDPGPTIISGINGPQPHRLGFTPLFDATYLASAATKDPANGRFTAQEYNGALRYTSMLGADWVFANTAQGGVRLWDGPNKPDLPGAVYRAGWDFLLQTPQAGPWSAQFDFNPSVNSDLQAAVGREGINLDGNITAFFRVSPTLLFVLGVQYWDRVDKIILPNAGVVWNPNDRLEVRLLFPKSRVSYFLGNIGNAAHWLYATAEYHVESYQIQMPGMAMQNQIQISDWRAAIGLRSDHSWYDKFIEVGAVFDRQAKFLHTTPSFDIDSGFMARFGVNF